MRIYGNREIKTLPGLNTRPTPARVREAIFNIWRGTIEDCSWLDLCAGNGTMGAEALCRGAKNVVGIEQSSRACGIIRQNWDKVSHEGQGFQVLRGDIVQRLKSVQGQQFDHIYFDPPYASKLYLPVLKAIATLQLLCETGEMAVEHDPKIWKSTDIPGLEICRQKVYGNTGITFYRPLGRA